MTNKNLKNILETKINKEVIYKSTLDKIERKNFYYRNRGRLIFSSLSLVGLIILSLFIHHTPSRVDLMDKCNVDDECIKINASDVLEQFDLDIKSEKITKLPEVKLLKNVEVPKDFEKFEAHKIFVKDEKTGKYDKLYNYEYVYNNKDNTKQIIIAFSDKNVPLQDYYFDNVGFASKINNTSLVIYQYENFYSIEFEYENYNFNIETKGITKEELISLLKSIIR